MERLERFFLKRYIEAPKRNLFRFSFVFMVLGIMLSVGILSAGLHLFQGYESTLRKLLLDSFSHIGISSAYGEMISEAQYEEIISYTDAFPEIESTIPMLGFPLMAQKNDKIRAASLKAYPDMADPPFAKYISLGKKNISEGEVIVGHYLMQELNLAIGDTLNLNYPRLDQITPLGIPSTRSDFRIAGVYRSGYYENDRSMVVVTMANARELMMQPDGYSKIELQLEDPGRAAQLNHRISAILGPDFISIPWNYYAESLLRLVAMEKWLIFIVFSFLVLIAGINVISTVSTIIIDQKAEIAVLKTLGASRRTIHRMLVYRVGMVGVLSVFAGQVLGALLSWFVEHQSFYRLKGDVYFIDTLGAKITLPNLAIIFAVATALIFICIMIPLRQIDRMQIIEVIRNKH